MTRTYEEFAHSEYKKALKPIKDAAHTLQELKRTYELVIVTSRGQTVVETTHKSLTLHYPSVFNDVYFVPLWGTSENATKAQICKEIGALYLIDDSFEHCSLAAEAGVNTILFGDYGWNRFQELPNRVSRCKTWLDVWHFLNK